MHHEQGMTKQLKNACVLAAFLVLAGLPLTGCAWMAGRIPAGEIPAPTQYDHYEAVNGVRFHYVEHPGPGENILLIHGFGSSTYTWKDVIPPLAERGFHVWALDMKGFGWSDKPLDADYSPQALAEDVNAFMEAKGLDQVIYAGNSLGGYVGQILTLNHPDKVSRLVLVDAAGEPTDRRPLIVELAHMEHAADMMKMGLGEWVIRLNLESAAYDRAVVTPERVRAYFDRLCTENGVEAQTAVARNVDHCAVVEHAVRLPEITIPTLIIWGENDTWIPQACAHMLHEDIPDSSLFIIPECGHIPQEEKPGLTAKTIGDFALGLGEKRCPECNQ